MARRTAAPAAVAGHAIGLAQGEGGNRMAIHGGIAVGRAGQAAFGILRLQEEVQAAADVFLVGAAEVRIAGGRAWPAGPGRSCRCRRRPRRWGGCGRRAWSRGRPRSAGPPSGRRRFGCRPATAGRPGRRPRFPGCRRRPGPVGHGRRTMRSSIGLRQRRRRRRAGRRRRRMRPRQAPPPLVGWPRHDGVPRRDRRPWRRWQRLARADPQRVPRRLQRIAGTCRRSRAICQSAGRRTAATGGGRRLSTPWQPAAGGAGFTRRARLAGTRSSRRRRSPSAGTACRRRIPPLGWPPDRRRRPGRVPRRPVDQAMRTNCSRGRDQGDDLHGRGVAGQQQWARNDSSTHFRKGRYVPSASRGARPA